MKAKKLISSTVFDKLVKTPVMKTGKYERYLKSKQCKALGYSQDSESHTYSLIFPDNSLLDISEQCYFTEDDHLVTVIRVMNDIKVDKRFVLPTKFNEKDLCNLVQ